MFEIMRNQNIQVNCDQLSKVYLSSDSWKLRLPSWRVFSIKINHLHGITCNLAERKITVVLDMFH